MNRHSSVVVAAFIAAAVSALLTLRWSHRPVEAEAASVGSAAPPPAPRIIDDAVALRRQFDASTAEVARLEKRVASLERELAELRAALAAQGAAAPVTGDAPQVWMAAEAAKLRAAPAGSLKFSQAKLDDVIRFLAEDAGMQFVMSDGLSARLGEQTYTFNLDASPFAALEQVAGAAGLRIEFERGVWHIIDERAVDAR